MMEFLYFPNDKSEYLPAIIIFAIFFIGAVLTTIAFYKKSKKDEKMYAEKYKHIQFENKEKTTGEK